MSDLTICNYCRLQNIRRRAKETNKEVSTKNGNPNEGLPAGIDIFVHPKKLKGEDRFQEQFNVAWFMELGNRCEC